MSSQFIKSNYSKGGFHFTKAVLCFIFTVFCQLTFAQTAAVENEDLPTTRSIEAIDLSWILAFEQAYGIYGLYISEPERPDDETLEIRRDLIHLTKLAWQYLEDNPGKTPSISDLYVEGLLDSLPDLPDGVEYLYSPELNRFVTNLGEDYDIVNGAMLQLQESERYRRLAIGGSFKIEDNLGKLAEEENIPEPVKREIETRLFIREFMAHPQIELMTDTQDRLRDLHTAILKGKKAELWQDGDTLTMQQIGETGLIEFLEALPAGGQYLLQPVPEPPIANFGARTVELDPLNLSKLIHRNASSYLENINPDYPPAMLIQASHSTDFATGFETMNRAIEIWPEVPALRVQRVAMSLQIMDDTYLGEDLFYTLNVFPSTPILLELISASSGSENPVVQEWHDFIINQARNIRPTVLPIQVTALKHASDQNNLEMAKEVFNFIIDQHPGYRPLLGEWVVKADE